MPRGIYKRTKPIWNKGMRGVQKHSEETKRKIGLKSKERIHSKETKEKIRISHLAEKNPMWKGDKVKLIALHEWIGNRLPKPKFCQDCNKVPPYDLANISQEYKRDLSDWEWLCRKCHMLKDGRLEKLKHYNRLRKIKKKKYVSK